MNRSLYEKVLECCCLTYDLQQMKEGDKTYIDPNSTNISGGQRNRIVLARAIYSQRKIMLLDNPLSALDIKVGEKINYNLHQLCKKDNLTIFMTLHSSYYIKNDDRIFYIKDRKLRE